MTPDWAEEEAKAVIENGYNLIREDDKLIQITERGLEEAIATALRQAYDKGVEDAAKVIETYYDPMGIGECEKCGHKWNTEANDQRLPIAIRTLKSKKNDEL